MADQVCVYAVVSGGPGALRVTGVSGERLRRARVAGVDLVIGRLARVPPPTAAALTRYDRAVRALMATHGSLLPARYGTCAATLDELAPTLRARREAVRRSLRLVRQRAQMTVRIFHGSEPARGLARGPLAASSQPARRAPAARSQSARSALATSSGGQGRQYLQQRAAEMHIPGAEPLRTAVARWVRAERVERLDRGRLAGSLYHLIPRGAAGAYRCAIERAALDAGLTMVVSGPWPPYAFAELSR